jgi:AraC-like DNA-binding protein
MTIKSNSNKTDYLEVSTTTAKTLINYLSSKGLDSLSIQKHIDFDLSGIDLPDSNLPLIIYKNLWNLAVKYTEDPCLGLRLALNPNNTEMNLVSHVFFNSQNLREGLKQYIRYYSLINESISVKLTNTNSKAIVSYHCNSPENYCSPDIEHSLAISVTRIKDHISDDLSLDEVHFEHSCHKLKLYEEFFGCPVYFNQKYSALIFKSKFLEYTFPKKSTHLFNFLISHLEVLLSKINKNETLSEQVARLIEKSLDSSKFDAENISCALHMSRHTLYRKLKTEGVSFHQLVDTVRKNKAFELLKKNQHGLSEIAFLLGFSELSSFSRAFKKWTGSSPAKFIQK